MANISEGLWRELSEEVMSGMKEWRMQHPRASLTEIEEALDERLGKMRARMIENAAMTSESVDIEAGQVKCPECGCGLQSRGKRKRKLKTTHNQEITLERGYGQCPKCKAGLFPPG